MVVYDRVARVVGPKRAALAQAESDLAAASAELAEKQATLKELMDKLALLQQQVLNWALFVQLVMIIDVV
jgi:dynein heavy chain, axonemal